MRILSVLSWGLALAVLPAMTAISQAQAVDPFLIEKALDERADIELKKVTLGQALEQVGRKMGVRIGVESAGPAFAQLPYGHLSEIESAQLQGISWREALTELLKPFSLTYQPGDTKISILGSDDLMRQPRRLTMAELNALVVLQTKTLSNKSDNLLRQLRVTTGIEFGLVQDRLHKDEVDLGPHQTVLTAQPAPASEVLSRYAGTVWRKGESSTWFVQGNVSEGRTTNINIVIINPKELVKMKLQRRIDLNFKNQPLQTILLDLANKAAVKLTLEPGSIGMVDPAQRDNCSLVASNNTIEQALEALSGLTGLEYYPDYDGVTVAAGDLLLTRKPGKVDLADRTVCILKVKLPDSDDELTILIRESDFKNAGIWDKYLQLRQENIAELMKMIRDYPIAEIAD
jgi:hypothetical protein